MALSIGERVTSCKDNRRFINIDDTSGKTYTTLQLLCSEYNLEFKASEFNGFSAYECKNNTHNVLSVLEDTKCNNMRLNIDMSFILDNDIHIKIDGKEIDNNQLELANMTIEAGKYFKIYEDNKTIVRIYKDKTTALSIRYICKEDMNNE